MRKQLTEGIYTSKELCEMIGYNYETFVKNRGRTCLSKLEDVCTVEKIGKGKGTKYIISNVKNIEFNINKRRSREVEYKTMSDLFKAPIIQLLINRENGAYTGTFDNWLVYTSLVQRGFKRQNEKFLKDSKTLKSIEKDFFNVEGQSLHYNFIQALEKLRKSRDIVWYKVRMVVEKSINAEGKEVEHHRAVKDDLELSILLEFENNFNKRYGIKDRNDLVYGNPKEGIKRNTTLLKEYDKQLKREMFKELGYKYTYTAYMVALKDNSDENKIKLRLEFCDNFDINLIKDDIYQYRRKKAELRQSRAKEEMIKGFGDKKTIIMLSETEVRQLQYEEKYVEEWLQLYKKYIHRYDN
ncbi:MAG: hypothetical protein J6D47_17190 [Peptostreptococcaceae bacterium]|nr:hypothetical protein [Peptostreptococcaceae bacterium]